MLPIRALLLLSVTIPAVAMAAGDHAVAGEPPRAGGGAFDRVVVPNGPTRWHGFATPVRPSGVVCHETPNGRRIRLELRTRAAEVHLAHGDVLAGTSGIGFDCVPRERLYVSDNPEVCPFLRWACGSGYVLFSDETGCGCETDN